MRPAEALGGRIVENVAAKAAAWEFRALRQADADGAALNASNKTSATTRARQGSQAGRVWHETKRSEDPDHPGMGAVAANAIHRPERRQRPGHAEILL